MTCYLSIKAAAGRTVVMRHSGRSRGHPTAGPVVRCSKPRLAPIYSPRLQINAQPRIPTASLLPVVNMGDRLFAETLELKRARFNGAVICVNDGVLDPEAAKTTDLLPKMSGLQMLSRSQLELEVHLCLRQINPNEAVSYVLAGAGIVTLHLESFLMPNGYGVDYEALVLCLEGIVNAGGRAGVAVYPTMCPNGTLTKLGALGSLHLVSHLTVIMGDIALATPDRRWRYISAMEDKVSYARDTLTFLGLEAEHIKVVALGKFNTTTISRVALATVDAITIADIDGYRFLDEGYAGNDMRYSVQEAGELIEGKLYGRPDLSVAEAAHNDAVQRAIAARNIIQYLARQWPEHNHPKFRSK